MHHKIERKNRKQEKQLSPGPIRISGLKYGKSIQEQKDSYQHRLNIALDDKLFFPQSFRYPDKKQGQDKNPDRSQIDILGRIQG